MSKLTDAQLVILSAAGKRESGSLLPLPKSLKMNKGAASTVLKSLLRHRLANECLAADGLEPWREEEDGTRVALVIAEAGLSAIGADAPATGERVAPRPKGKPDTRSRSGKKAETVAAVLPVRQGTKLAQLIALLGRKEGCSIAEAIEATGWQAHSIRGAISGALKKKLGLTVASEPMEERGRVYRIVTGR